MSSLKYSRQRESIKEFLAARKDHPTADTVYSNMRKAHPNISLGTVYRNLSLLSDLGEIMKFSVGDGADRFDGCTKPHNHFLCSSCHSVIDLEMENTDDIKERAGKSFDGKIDSYTTLFYGTCGKCIENF